MRRAIWQQIYERFDPERPAEHPEWRAARERSPAAHILRDLEIPFGIPRVLLTGTVGTGKTTELLRIAEQRARTELVVYLDLERHFSDTVGDAAALHGIASWEVCFLAGLAVLRAAEANLGFRLPEEHMKRLSEAWRGLAGATSDASESPRLDLASLARSLVLMASSAAAPGAGAAGLRLLGAVAEAGKWSAPIGLGKSALPDQDGRMQALLDAVNTILGLVQHHGPRILLVLDGLDRIRDLQHAKSLFIESRVIARLACSMVVCGPFALRHSPATAAVGGFSQTLPLVNEPVLDQHAPERHGAGVTFFRELFRRRTEDLGATSPLAELREIDELAYYSGGRARDFVHSVRRLAALSWLDDAPRVVPELVTRVLDERRREKEVGLHQGHIDLLQAIIADPRHRLPEGPFAQELLSYGILLPYPNESEWYYPHPLLTKHLLRSG